MKVINLLQLNKKTYGKCWLALPFHSSKEGSHYQISWGNLKSISKESTTRPLGTGVGAREKLADGKSSLIFSKLDDLNLTSYKKEVMIEIENGFYYQFINFCSPLKTQAGLIAIAYTEVYILDL